MRLGAHISAAGGLHTAPERAAELGLECFQFFSRSPQGGRVPALTDEQIALFLAACDRHGFDRYYVHAPYIINLASPDDRLRSGSVETIREELARSSALNVTAVMTHLGSATGGDRRQGVAWAAEGLRRILAGYDGSARLLVELAAGAGHILGDSFGEIRAILDLVGDDRLGVCLDTAHVFASGYDLRTPAAVAGTIGKFDAEIGLDKLSVIHLNDSQAGLGARYDRHEHLGQGEIGAAGLRALVTAPELDKIDLILETPNDAAGRAADLKLLKRSRDKI